MVRIVVLAIALVAITSAARAAPPTPMAITRGVYDHLIAASATGGAYDPSDEALYSPRLKSLVAAARKAAGTDVPCGLDFDIWFDGQEYDLKKADVAEAPGATPAAETIVAKFDSLGKPHEVHFSYRLIASRWRLDDAESVIGDKWVFSRLLQCKD